MKTKTTLVLSALFVLFFMTGCGLTEESPIAQYDTVTCLFVGVDSTETPDYGPIIIGYTTTQVTSMTEDGNDVYGSQEEIDNYIEAKFSGNHYDFIENRVATFEDSGYECTYE